MAKNINLIAPINTRSYGYVGVNMLNELSSVSDVSLFPIGQIEVDRQEFVDNVRKGIENAQLRYDREAPSLRIWHQFALAEHVGKGKHVGFPIFELNDFNDNERYHLENQDEVFVPSKWAASIVKEKTAQTNVKVVPLGVDPNVFKPIKQEKKGDEPYVFLNVGKWEKRKGHDILAEAFNRAFTPKDNVMLWMMPHNPFLNKEMEGEWRGLYKNSPMGYRIKIGDWVQHQREIASIMNQADCGVFPSRAEGWNLELLEMMACGKPVIATNYSAHTEYCSDLNSMLIPISKTEPANDGLWFHGQGEWGEFDDDAMDALVEHMRKAYEKRMTSNMAGQYTAGQYTWRNMAATAYFNLFK